MSELGLLGKDRLKKDRHGDNGEGVFIDDNPLDLSDGFIMLCDACRTGDLKVCQEMISEGVNINAKDSFDYTPLILVCCF
jgi:ankyrin repeat and BTB/POZ domain-containing protein 1